MGNLSQALKEAYARSSSSTRQLSAVTLTHNTFPGGAIYIVNHDSDVTVDGNLYTGMAMEVNEPESGTEPDDKVAIRIDGVAGTMQFWISSAIRTATNIPVQLKLFAFNMVDETVIDTVGTYDFLLLNAQYDAQTVVLEIGHISPTNQSFPGIFYTPDNSPELYR